MEAYGIDGVPAFAVNGKYFTSPSMVGSNEGVLKVIDELVARERAARK
jgi:thiol:disulfide interchange protein DsbA